MIYYIRIIEKAETSRNDFGPYRTYNSIDGKEYLILASENAEGNLDLRYCTNTPAYGTAIPPVFGPFPVKLHEYFIR